MHRLQTYAVMDKSQSISIKVNHILTYLKEIYERVDIVRSGMTIGKTDGFFDTAMIRLKFDESFLNQMQLLLRIPTRKHRLEFATF